MENGIAKLQELVDQYDNIVFFGGAGVSTESGIPDFRQRRRAVYIRTYDYPPETILKPYLFYEKAGGVFTGFTEIRCCA